MRPWRYAFILATILAAACGSHRPVLSESPSLTAAQTATVQANVRTFAQAVAHDVTQDGPGAWRKHFSQSPSFFMVVEGHMAFPNPQSATAGIRDFARAVQRIELMWGDDLRVDPLASDLAVLASSYHEVRINTAGSRVDEDGFFTGIAEYREGHWQFRNAHWSWPVSAPRVQ